MKKPTTFDDVPDIMTINDEELTHIVGGCGKKSKGGGGGGCQSACASGQINQCIVNNPGPPPMAAAPQPNPISVEASYTYNGQTTTSSG